VASRTDWEEAGITAEKLAYGLPQNCARRLGRTSNWRLEKKAYDAWTVEQALGIAFHHQ